MDKYEGHLCLWGPKEILHNEENDLVYQTCVVEGCGRIKGRHQPKEN